MVYIHVCMCNHLKNYEGSAKLLSDDTVNDGKWHRLQAKHVRNSGMLKIDDLPGETLPHAPGLYTPGGVVVRVVWGSSDGSDCHRTEFPHHRIAGFEFLLYIMRFLLFVFSSHTPRPTSFSPRTMTTTTSRLPRAL